MKQNEWMKRYWKEVERLGRLTEKNAAWYRLEKTTGRLRKTFPYDPEGAAIFMARYADRKVLPWETN